MTRQRGLAKFLLVIAMLAASTAARSLSCAPPSHTIDESYDASDSIVIGVVSHCEVAESQQAWVQGGERCSFAVLEILKDASPSRDYNGMVNSSACGLSVRVGEQYLLFLDAENRPLPFSVHLPAEPTAAGRLEARIDLLRRYRDGRVDELSEPWVFRRTITEACSLSLYAGYGNRLEFTRRPPHAMPLEDIDWEGMEANGVPLFQPGQLEDMRRRFATMPPPPDDPPHRLEVTFQEPRPNAPRQATLRIGGQARALQREQVPLPEFIASETLYRYGLVGDEVLEVLDALAQPTDVLITATLDTPAPEPEAAPGNGAAGTTPDASSSVGVVPGAAQRRPAQSVRSRPKPSLGFETRSANIVPALEKYRACNAPR